MMFRHGVTLKPYQKRAALFAFVKHNAALFMAKGVGKTLTALKVVQLSQAKEILIVTNTRASIINWHRQIELFVEPIYLSSIHISLRIYSPYVYKDIGKPDIIILDESHAIKNRRSKRFKVLMRLVKRFPQARRLIMTATPTSINSLDLWSQYVFLGVLEYNWTAFRDAWCKNYGFMSKQIRIRKDRETEFMSIIDKHTVYAGEEVLHLKPHEENTVFLTLVPPTDTIYRILEDEFILGIQGIEVITPNTLAQMSKLHQICGGTVKTEYGTKLLKPCVKEDWVVSYLKSYKEKIVIFCAYNNEIIQLSAVLTKAGINNVMLYGETRDKFGWLRFQKDKNIRVIIVQFKSGSQSIELTASNTIIYYSLNFNFIDYDQSLGRIRRIGQEKATKAIFLITKGTIDAVIHKNLDKKGKLARSVFDHLKRKGK